MISEISSSGAHSGTISGSGYNSGSSFGSKFQDFQVPRYLYITQIKEYHEENPNDIIQVWYGDLRNETNNNYLFYHQIGYSKL